MAPINLSQSYSTNDQPALQVGKIFDKNFYFAIGLILLALAGLGGLKFYNHSLETKTKELDKYLDGESQKLINQTANELADFQYRMDNITLDLDKKNQSLSKPDRYFSVVESMLLPQAKLSKFTVNLKENSIMFDGTIDNYRSLAMQTTAFRQDKNIASFTLDSFSKQEKVMNFSITTIINPLEQDE